MLAQTSIRLHVCRRCTYIMGIIDVIIMLYYACNHIIDNYLIIMNVQAHIWHLS